MASKRKHSRKSSKARARRSGPTPRSTPQAARPAVAKARRKPDPVTDAMFFPRLLRQARWLFALLALAFALGFIVFGVGSTVGGTGLSDLFQGRVAQTGPSVGDLEEKVADNPKDAGAWRDLSQAHLQDGNRQKAIETLEQYLRLRPRDSTGIEDLASLQLSQALETGQRLEAAQTSLPRFTPPSEISPVGPLAEIVRNSFAEASQQQLQARLAPLQQRYSRQLGDSLATYERLVVVSPENPNAQLQLAQVAEQAGRYEIAVAAYRRYVALAPDDPLTEQVKTRLKELEGFLASQPTPSG